MRPILRKIVRAICCFYITFFLITVKFLIPVFFVFQKEYLTNDASHYLEPLYDSGKRPAASSSDKSLILSGRPIMYTLQLPKGLCHGLFSGDPNFQELASKYNGPDTFKTLPSQTLIDSANDCQHFEATRGYHAKPINNEELHFPIAYSIIMHERVEQTELLLKAIYMPQNFYCIHVDKKSSRKTFEAIKSIVKCFDNVFLASKRVPVHWGRFGVLQADMICLRQLFSAGRWKYFINLTGDEFPLKTNAEIVKILKVFNGAVDVRYEIGNKRFEWRTRYTQCPNGTFIPRPNYTEPPPGITIAKGPVHVILSRGFADFVLHNQSAIDFLAWVKDTVIPDETYFASLNASPALKIPGSYIGASSQMKSFTRFKKWLNCGDGRMVHNICLLTIKWLPALLNSHALFANKFHMDYHPLALRCLEELIQNRTFENYRGIYSLKMGMYRNAPFVKYHL